MKILHWIWKWRWALGALLWLAVVTPMTINESGWWTGGYVVGSFIIGFSYADEKRKIREKEARDAEQA